METKQNSFCYVFFDFMFVDKPAIATLEASSSDDFEQREYGIIGCYV